MSGKELRMTFDPRTIEHLGIKMYSSFHAALAELIANAYDANARNVHIEIIDNKDKKIIVKDDGDGMDFSEINNKFLVIGRNRRTDEKAEMTHSGRKVMGRKGLGKLSLFGLGNTVEITTTKRGSTNETKFYLDWDDIKEAFNEKLYKPKYKEKTIKVSAHGTEIVLYNLTRKKKFDVDFLKNKLVQMFHGLDDNFKVFISYNCSAYERLDEKMKYKTIDKQFEWDFEKFAKKIKSDYKNKNKITGMIFSSKYPLPAHQRGITIFANKRMANEPSFFNAPLESNFFFSYITGWLDIDFIDEGEDEIISTSRQNINWDNEGIDGLQDFLIHFLRELETDWRIKRKEAKRKELTLKTGINIKKWTSTMPKDLGDRLEGIVDDIVGDVSSGEEITNNTIKQIHGIIPEYPYYHWRHLHATVKKASKEYYINKDFYDSIQEALKRYVASVRKKSSDQASSEVSLMMKNFGFKDGKVKNLSVISKYKKPDGTDFHNDTKASIEESQSYLSGGIVSGFRNPLAHEEKRHLHDSGVLTEKDCLDALSLLSYLFRRLDDA